MFGCAALTGGIGAVLNTGGDLHPGGQSIIVFGLGGPWA